MNEFRRPYEYDEETGVSGFILLFLVTLLSLETLLGIIYLTQIYDMQTQFTIFKSIMTGVLVLHIVYILFTGVSLFKIKKYALKIIQSYLLLRVIYLGTATVMLFINTVNDPYAIGDGIGQFQSVQDIAMRVLVSPLTFILLFSITWFVYFCRSKKVNQVYGCNLRLPVFRK